MLSVVELAIVGAMFHAIGFSHGSSHEFRPHFGSPAFAANAHEDFNKTFEINATPSVYIDDSEAAVTVSVKPGSAVSVREQSAHSGWIRGEDTTLDVAQDDKGVRIVRAEKMPTLVMFGSLHRTLDVVVPPGAHVQVANAGNISLTGLRENATLRSENGSIKVYDHHATIVATSSNGRIELHDVSGPSVTASSDNGRIVLDKVQADALFVHADNGRITGSSVTTRGGTVQANNGRITLGLAQDSDVTVTAQASSGHVVAKAPLAFEPQTTTGDEDDNGQPRTVRVGNGTGKLQVSSDNGSITISLGRVTL